MGQLEGRPNEEQDHQDEDLSNNEKSLVHTQQLSVDQKQQLSPLQSEELVIMQISHLTCMSIRCFFFFSE